VEIGWNTVQNLIEGGPAGCEKANISLNIPLIERLEIRREKYTGCPEVSRRCSRHTLDNLECFKGGWRTEGETGTLGHTRIAQASSDEMVQRRHFVFACSTPPDPLERLSEHAAFGSNLKSNSKSLHTDSLMVLALLTPGERWRDTETRSMSSLDCNMKYHRR
jgi:hypothetical protein